jgi:DNA-binding NarL/FixJ family response regulator
MGGIPRVVIADDHPAMRYGIRLRLELDAGATVVGEADNGVLALQLLHDLRPDIAVVDMRMPGLDGIEVATRARREGLSTRVIVLTALADTALVQRALAAGVRGYVDKLSPTEVLVRAIEAVMAGDRFVDPKLLANVVDLDREQLSARELEVLQLAANGMQNKVIALELDLSEETVKSHLRNVLRKLGASSRTEAVAAAMRRSIIS